MPKKQRRKGLLKHLFQLIGKHREVFKQERVYQRTVALVLAEIFVFARHTITQLIMTLGMTEQDWSGWYRLFSHRRFNYDKASEMLFRETLEHVDENGLYVVGGDATQTPRSNRKLEGSSWLRNLRNPPFMVGIHAAQRELVDPCRRRLQPCGADQVAARLHREIRPQRTRTLQRMGSGGCLFDLDTDAVKALWALETTGIDGCRRQL